jgi:hypothetical protein
MYAQSAHALGQRNNAACTGVLAPSASLDLSLSIIFYVYVHLLFHLFIYSVLGQDHIKTTGLAVIFGSCPFSSDCTDVNIGHHSKAVGTRSSLMH